MKLKKFKVGFRKSDALEYETVRASTMSDASTLAAASRIHKGKPSAVVSVQPASKIMKTTLLSLWVALGVTQLSAQTNEPSAEPFNGDKMVREVPREDLHTDHPSGYERRQYYKIVEQHVIRYPHNGKTLSVTNEIITDRIIGKDMIRSGSEWVEKPKP